MYLTDDVLIPVKSLMIGRFSNDAETFQTWTVVFTHVIFAWLVTQNMGNELIRIESLRPFNNVWSVRLHTSVSPSFSLLSSVSDAACLLVCFICERLFLSIWLPDFLYSFALPVFLFVILTLSPKFSHLCSYFEQHPNCSWSSVELIDLQTLDRLPVSTGIRIMRDAFKQYRRRPVGQWTVNDVSVTRDPSLMSNDLFLCYTPNYASLI